MRAMWRNPVSCQPVFEPNVLIASAVIVLAASVLQGVTGFGYNIVVIPLLTIYLEPAAAVTAVVLHNVVLNAVLLLNAWRSARVRRIWLLALAGAVATPAGALVLRAIEPAPARIIIGVFVIATGVAMLAGFTRAFRSERLASGVVGLAAGVTNGAVGMAGPPVILFFANQGMPPREFRANIVAFFAVATLVAVPSFVATGVLTPERARFGAALMPAVIAGVVAGVILHPRVSDRTFRRLTLTLVVLAGAVALMTGLRTL